MRQEVLTRHFSFDMLALVVGNLFGTLFSNLALKNYVFNHVEQLSIREQLLNGENCSSLELWIWKKKYIVASSSCYFSFFFDRMLQNSALLFVRGMPGADFLCRTSCRWNQWSALLYSGTFPAVAVLYSLFIFLPLFS